MASSPACSPVTSPAAVSAAVSAANSPFSAPSMILERIHGAENRLVRRGAARLGVFTWDDVLAAGGDAALIRRRIRQGRWERLGREVYGVVGAPTTADRRLLIAYLSLGGEAAITHRACEWLWGLAGRELQVVELSVPVGRAGRLKGAVVHRASDLDRTIISWRRGLPTTSPLRLLVDLGAVYPMWRVQQTFDRAFAAKLITPMGALAELNRVARRGRSGVGALRAILDEAGVTGSHAPSVLEAKSLRLIRRAGLPEPTPQLTVGAHGEYRLDFPFPEVMLNVEVDGWTYHASEEAKHHDLTRQNSLSLAGYAFLRYDWTHITREGRRVVAEIRTAYDARRNIL